MPQQPSHSVVYQGREIAYRVVPSRRRGLALCLDPEEGLLVRAPPRVSPGQVERLVLDKAPWVLGHLERLARQGLPPPPRAYAEGEKFPFLGRDYALSILRGRAGGRPRVELLGQGLVVSLAQDLGAQAKASAVARALALWYRRQAGQHLPPRVAYFAQALGQKPPLVRVRDQKRRWGSCNPQGGLNLNWRLVMAPLELIDYVAAHEVCHLIEPNHSPGFWEVLGRLLPDCRERRQRLNRLGPFLRL